MQEHVTSAANEIAQAANAKASVMVANTAVASGVVITSREPEMVSGVKIGEYLTTHGIGIFSYMEIISIIGAVYLSYQFSISIYDRFLSKQFRGKSNGQQTGQ